MQLSKILFPLIPIVLLLGLIELLPQPHHHFTRHVQRNPKLQSDITLCTFYGDTMQVRANDKHIEYQDHVRRLVHITAAQ